MRKKIVNPFKMWETYLGAIILWLSLNISFVWYNLFYVTLWQRLFGLPAVNYSAVILSIIIGFGIGWIIAYYRRK